MPGLNLHDKILYWMRNKVSHLARSGASQEGIGSRRAELHQRRLPPPQPVQNAAKPIALKWFKLGCSLNLKEKQINPLVYGYRRVDPPIPPECGIDTITTSHSKVLWDRRQKGPIGKYRRFPPPPINSPRSYVCDSVSR